MTDKNKNAQERQKGFYEHRPRREFKASLSKDGRYWIFKDITTHIVPKEYLDKANIIPAGGPECERFGGDKKVDD